MPPTSPSIAAPAQPHHGRGVHATWMYTLGSILFVVVVLASCVLLVAAPSFADSRSPIDASLLVLMLVTAVVQVRYCWFLRVGRGGGLPRTAWNVALLAPAGGVWVLGLFALGFDLISAFPLWISLCLMACLLAKRPRNVLLIAGLGLVVLHPYLYSWVLGEPAEAISGNGIVMLIFYSALLPFMLLSGLWWWEIVVELDRNRRAAAELAVAQERLRFAADLHDIQGHHLQVIALKSELAERLLDIDIEAARANIHETRLIAKQALEETRLLVSGYREIALDDEIENAREVLSASGAECTLELDTAVLNAGADAASAGLIVSGGRGPELRHALAMAVREATTNILRHSTATQASIRLSLSAGACELVVTNNGLIEGAAPSRVPGSGLAGLRERVTALGGELDTTIDPSSDSFALRVWVPFQQEAAA